MDVDVKIYISNFKKFFNENPNELSNLIGKADPDEFFDEIENGEEIELTKKQIISVVINLNNITPKPKEEIKSIIEPYFETSYGKIFLN
jgi:hypothetical protein